MTMLLAYSTWGMRRTPIDLAVAHCARLGFDGLELTVVPRWPTDAALLDAAARRHIRQLYDDHEIALCGLSGNTPMLVADAARERANIATFKGYLDLAAELQRPSDRLSVTTTSAGLPEEWDAVKDKLVATFGELADHAARTGTIVGVEPHINQALCRPEQAIWLIDQVNSPALRVHFDISHFNVQGDPMETTIAQLVPYSAHTHVKDERGIVPDHQFLIPGEGDMDYVNYLRLMDRAGYHGYIAVEISLMVQSRPDYDALAAATQSYAVVSKAFADAGIERRRA